MMQMKMGKRNIMGNLRRLRSHRRTDTAGKMYVWNNVYCSQQTSGVCSASNLHTTLGKGLMIASGLGRPIVDYLALDTFENTKDSLNLKN